MLRISSFFLIFVFSIAGYTFLRLTPATENKITRSSGYHTFLFSAGAGLILFIIAFFFFLLGKCINHFCSSLSFSAGNYFLYTVLKIDEVSYWPTVIIDLSISTLILSVLLPLILRKMISAYYKVSVNKLRRTWFSEDKENPEFTKLFFKSYELGVPILFTMSDRKVFIGFVYEIHSSNFNDVYVLPLFSGHRSSDTLEVELKTPYISVIDTIRKNSEALQKTKENESVSELELDDEHLMEDNVCNTNVSDLKKFVLALPLREIVHAHLHDFKLYVEFKKKEKEHETGFNYSIDYLDYNPDQSKDLGF